MCPSRRSVFCWQAVPFCRLYSTIALQYGRGIPCPNWGILVAPVEWILWQDTVAVSASCRVVSCRLTGQGLSIAHPAVLQADYVTGCRVCGRRSPKKTEVQDKVAAIWWIVRIYHCAWNKLISIRAHRSVCGYRKILRINSDRFLKQN
jgi:hypothetical protein